MKTVTDIQGLLGSKLLGDARTDFSIWNVSPGKSDPYPLKISLSAPRGRKLSEAATNFSSWKQSMMSLAEEMGCSVALENRKVPKTTAVIAVPVSIEVPTRDVAIAIVGDRARSAVASCTGRWERLRSRAFAPEAAAEFIWKTRKRSDIDFNLLVTAAEWARGHETAGMTPRELPIPDMQGKLLNPKGDRVLVALLAGKPDLGLRDRPKKVELQIPRPSGTDGIWALRPRNSG